MYKRLLSLFTTTLLLASLLMPAMPAQATGSTTTSPQPSVSDLIISGLWGGINVIPWGSAGTAGTTGKIAPNRPAGTPATPAPAPVSPATPQTSQAYVALGDSVAAGVGLPTAAPLAAGMAAQSACGRTAEAYPNEVARAMGLPLIHAACSGATVRDLYTPQLSGLALLPAQLNIAFTGGTPRIMTITAGANDVFWEQFLRTCASTLNCANAAGTELANSRLQTVQARLIYAFDQINLRSGNRPPTVVVTGYYNPVSPACTSVRPSVSAEEVRWMTAAVDALNQTIRQTAARYPFVRFAPVDFTGHDICSAQPWVQGLESARPIHPTTEGQRVIARSVLTTLGR